MIRKFQRSLLPAFGLAAIFIVANAVISYWSITTLSENRDRVSRSQEIIEYVYRTLSAVKHAETSQRGYLLTGDTEFLDRYQTSIGDMESSLDALDRLTADDAEQNLRVPLLRQALNDRKETLDENIVARRDRGLQEVLDSRSLYQGRAEMNRVLMLMDELRHYENAVLEQRRFESRTSARNVTITIVAANLAGLALLLAAYTLIRRQIAERERSKAELQKAHDELEERVIQRTEELARANTELERSNRELQDFAYVASHDLQEPLRKIQAFGDRLKVKHRGGLNEEAGDYLDRMQNAARRMHILINDLLMFSRVTTKAQPFVETDLDAITNDVLSDLEVLLQQTGGTVEKSGLPSIEADPLQMRQLMQNLIANALKFHRDGIPPIIRITGSPSGPNANGSSGPQHLPEYTITVEDNGIGFDEKYLDRIFTPFQRLHGRGVYDGTGIGLAVCRKIVERHGGTLTAQSTPGKGSKFIVTLPAKQDQERNL